MTTGIFQITWWREFLASQKVALLLTGATIVLAFWGFAIERDVGDSAYSTLRLFNVDLDYADQDLPWQIQAARFLAPIALAYAFLVALATVLRTQLQGFLVRHFYRGHVVVVGLGKQESLVARQLRDSAEGFRIVGLDVDEASGAISGLRSSGVPVVIGDARDPEILTQVRPGKADHIIVFTGDDSTNLEVLAALYGQLPKESKVSIHVVIDSPYLWISLHRYQFDRSDHSNKVEFICLPDRAAGLMVDAAEAEEGLDGSKLNTHLAVAGDATISARLIVHLARSPVFGSVGKVSVLVNDVEECDRCRRVLEETDPWVFGRVDIRVRLIEETESVADEISGPEATLGFIVGLNEADTLATTLKMRERVGQDARIFAGVPDQDVADAVRPIGLDLKETEFVPVGELVEGSHLMYGAAHELIARGRHKVYVRERISAGETSEDNPSLVSWEELPTSLRKSNRDYANSVAEKLEVLGARLAPLEGNEPAELRISPEKLEELAKDEHDRWCRDLIRNGWKPTDGPKDPEKKLHPLLVPWGELGEDERQKDRESILGLPEMFASVGFSLSLD